MKYLRPAWAGFLIGVGVGLLVLHLLSIGEETITDGYLLILGLSGIFGAALGVIE